MMNTTTKATWGYTTATASCLCNPQGVVRAYCSSATATTLSRLLKSHCKRLHATKAILRLLSQSLQHHLLNSR